MKSSVTVSLVEEARGGPFVLWDGLPDACRKAEQIGFDAIEIFAPAADFIEPDSLSRLLADHGLALAAVGTGAGKVKHGLHLALPDESQRREACEFIRSIIDFGGPFGAPAIVGSMQGKSGNVDKKTARSLLAEALDELGEHAAQYGVPLIFEPLNRYETDQVTTVADGLALLEELSTNNVKLLADLFHMNIEETDLAAAIRTAGDRIGHVHFVDSNRRPVGHGHLDVRPVVGALREVGYAGYLSAEAFPYPDPDEAARQTMRALRYWTGIER